MFSRILNRTASAPTSRSRAALVCMLALAMGAGCSAEADIPEIVVTRSDVEFLGVPVIPGFTDGVQSTSTSFDHPSDVELPSGLNPELRPLSASIQGNGDMQDLSFLESISVAIDSRAPDGPPRLVVASYEKSGAGNVGRSLKLNIDSDADVLSYWDTKQAFYEVSLAGLLPSEDWSIDVTFSFSGRFSISASD